MSVEVFSEAPRFEEWPVFSSEVSLCLPSCHWFLIVLVAGDSVSFLCDASLGPTLTHNSGFTCKLA